MALTEVYRGSIELKFIGKLNLPYSYQQKQNCIQIHKQMKFSWFYIFYRTITLRRCYIIFISLIFSWLQFSLTSTMSICFRFAVTFQIPKLHVKENVKLRPLNSQVLQETNPTPDNALCFTINSHHHKFNKNSRHNIQITLFFVS